MSQVRRKTPALFDRRLGEWEPKPQYIPFPEFEQPPPPASPVIPFIRGQWLGDATEPLVGTGPRHLPFPYFEQPTPPANPVILFRLGGAQIVVMEAEAFIIARPGFAAFPFFAGGVAPPASLFRQLIDSIDITRITDSMG